MTKPRASVAFNRVETSDAPDQHTLLIEAGEERRHPRHRQEAARSPSPGVGGPPCQAELSQPINMKSPAADPRSSLTAQYDRMLWNLNHHDALQRQADRRDLELKAWSRILQSDTLLAMFMPLWKQ